MGWGKQSLPSWPSAACDCFSSFCVTALLRAHMLFPLPGTRRSGHRRQTDSSLCSPRKIAVPAILRMPPQALHSLHNIDTKLFRPIRLEYKKGFSEE